MVGMFGLLHNILPSQITANKIPATISQPPTMAIQPMSERRSSKKFFRLDCN